MGWSSLDAPPSGRVPADAHGPGVAVRRVELVLVVRDAHRHERELADVYGVSAGTVRRAVRELRERGLVVTLPAKGTYVAEPPSGDPADKSGS